MFVERVAGIELLKTERRRALETSLQVQGLVDPASYAGTAPGETFSPSFNPSQFILSNPQGGIRANDYSWFSAPHLGLQTQTPFDLLRSASGSGVQI